MKFKTSVIFAAAILILAPVQTSAAETAALSTSYLERVPARLGHGLVNTLFGWTALFIAPKEALDHGETAGEAFGRHLSHPISYTFLGVWDLATFWVPGELGRSMAVPRHVFMPGEFPETAPAPAPVESGDAEA